MIVDLGPKDVSVVHKDFDKDGFYNLRTSSPSTVFRSHFEYNLNPLMWDTISTNGGTVTHDAATGTAVVNSGTNNTGSIIFQTHHYIPYQPSKTPSFAISFVMTFAANNTIRAGCFDTNDGHFLERDNSGVLKFVSRRNGSVISTVAQSAWSVDRLDGSLDPVTNPSKLTLDLTKVNRLTIEFQYSGEVRYFFSLAGENLLVHEVSPTNNSTLALIARPSLPIRFESVNSGSTTGGTIRVYATSVNALGGVGFVKEKGFILGEDRQKTFLSILGANTNYQPIMSIRPTTTFGTRVNRAIIIPQSVLVLTETKLLNFAFILGKASDVPATLTGATWAGSRYGNNAVNSCVDVDFAATSVTNGIKIPLGLIQSNSTLVLPEDIVEQLAISLHANGITQDTLTLAALTTGGNTNMLGGFSWKEVR